MLQTRLGALRPDQLSANAGAAANASTMAEDDVRTAGWDIRLGKIKTPKERDSKVADG